MPLWLSGPRQAMAPTGPGKFTATFIFGYNFYAAAEDASSIARASASSAQGKARSAAQTCRLPGPTSKREEQYTPPEILVAHGTQFPPGPLMAFPIRTFTEPGGGLDTRAEETISLAKFMAAPFIPCLFQFVFGQLMAAIGILPAGFSIRWMKIQAPVGID